jgi:hypothetical protein
MTRADWHSLAATSHARAAQAVREKLQARESDEAALGLDELIEALGRSDKRALRSQLTRLMAYIIKWRLQPERRSRSWVATIANARVEIEALLEDEPAQRRNLSLLWDRCLDAANRVARAETGVEGHVEQLDEAEVFDAEYRL